MIPNGSRYQSATQYPVYSHVYDENGMVMLDGEKGLTSLRLMRYLRNALYMMDTDSEVIPANVSYYAKEGENPQFLAFKFLNDPRRWTDIARLNPHVWYPLDVKPGTPMRIPIQ